MISGWGSFPDYTEAMPRARAFIPLRGNQAVDPYRVYLDRLAAEDIRYDVYADHRGTRPFDDISLFSGWLACSSTITVPYLPERVMRQFGYTQTIPRHPAVSAPLGLTRREIDDIFADYEHHLVPEEARATTAPTDWACADGYISWFFTVSHPYMVPTAPGSPPRPAHQEILEEQQSQMDHTQDVLPRCRRILQIARSGIEAGFFPEGSGGRRILDDIITEAEGALQYRRHRTRTGGVGGRGHRRGGRGGSRGGDGGVVRHTQ